MIQEGRIFWLKRNEKLHQKNAHDTDLPSQITQQVKDLYALQMELSPHDCQMFDIPLEQRLSQSVRSLTIWVKQTYVTTKRAIVEYAQKTASGQQDIRSFFTTMNSHTQDT